MVVPSASCLLQPGSLSGCAALLLQGRSNVSIGFTDASCTPLKPSGSAMASQCTPSESPLDQRNSLVYPFQRHLVVATKDQRCMHGFTAPTSHFVALLQCSALDGCNWVSALQALSALPGDSTATSISNVLTWSVVLMHFGKRLLPAC